MAEAQLPAVTATGSQTNTQSPQTGGSYGPAAASSGVQPGTSNNLLTSSNGISLAPGPVTTVNLGQATGATIAAPVSKHHFNTTLMGFSILLFVVAIILFKLTADFGKKHNQYQ